jgi:uncharacterized protein YbjT (DUF2867 family)
MPLVVAPRLGVSAAGGCWLDAGHGRRLVDELVETGADFRALVRSPAKAGLPAGVELVEGDLRDPASVEQAVGGVDAAFLLWALAEFEPAPEVVAAIERHARRIVYLSAIGVPDDPDIELDPILDSHRRMERLIESSSLEWTLVRAGGLAGNTLGWADDIRSDGVVREPFGGVARALVHERDVAAVAAVALSEDGHAGQRYEVTGPEVVTAQEQVEAIADAIGRPLRLDALTREQARGRLLTMMGDEATVDGMLDAWARMIADGPTPPTGALERVTGRRGTTYEQWARDHVADFT